MNANDFFENTQGTGVVTVSSGRIKVNVDAISGLMRSIVLEDNREIRLRQNFYWYKGADRSYANKPSGAYIFNPVNIENMTNPTHYLPVEVAKRAHLKIVRGPLVEEIHQTFAKWLTQIIRVHRNYDYVEFEWVVGPIPTVMDYATSPAHAGYEIITRYETDLQTNGSFFTDTNGREVIRRRRNYRSNWKVENSEPVASNYYPVTSWIFLRDYQQQLQMTVLTDRPQGGSSILDGTIELMLHRRLLFDDYKGMEEALNELGEDGRGLVVRGKHKLLLNTFQESLRQIRTVSKTLMWRPVATFSRETSLSTPHMSPLKRLRYSGITRSLPMNVHLLTLEPWENNWVLLRYCRKINTKFY